MAIGLIMLAVRAGKAGSGASEAPGPKTPDPPAARFIARLPAFSGGAPAFYRGRALRRARLLPNPGRVYGGGDKLLQAADGPSRWIKDAGYARGNCFKVLNYCAAGRGPERPVAHRGGRLITALTRRR